MKRPVFDIPAIHNELEALAEHLDIDSDLIEVFSKNEFCFNGQSYKVNNGAGGNNGKVIEFNSQLWSVAYKSSN